jgi:predicted SPOUT superfamily RNA methylase MTH1
MYSKELSIAIPASVVSDTPHLREKTSKIGLIGRAAAIFRVDEVIVYPDNPQAKQAVEADMIVSMLSYMETPQYLRKKLFKLKPELQYAGILPPLRTPHHPLDSKLDKLRVGEYREGITLSETEKGTVADIGVEQPALVRDVRLPLNKRVTVKIVKINKRVEVELAHRSEITEYWGYVATACRRSLGNLLRSGSFDLVIATSKYGSPFADVAEELSGRWRKSKATLVVFGAPTQGLNEIVRREQLRLGDLVDFVVNTIPAQGTETVRTEEAILATLAVLNSMSSLKKSGS